MTLAIANRPSLQTRLNDQVSNPDKTNNDNSLNAQQNANALHGSSTDMALRIPPCLINDSGQFQLDSEQASAFFHATVTSARKQQSAQAILGHISEIPATQLAPNIDIANAVFLDQTKAALLQVGDTKVLIIQSTDNTNRVYQVNADGTLGNQLYIGDTITPTESVFDSLRLHDDDQTMQLVVTGIENDNAYSSHQLEINLTENKLVINSLYDNCEPLTQSEWWSTMGTEHTSTVLWSDLTVLNLNKPAGTELTLDEIYDFYSNTAEGKLILDQEKDYHNPGDDYRDEFKELFISRVKFNRGEGGIELFSNFMPNRTALLDDPEALEQYDEQYQLFLNEIKTESKIAETGLPLDPSLQVILASGMAEAYAQSPERVNQILTDIDRGWTIQYEFEDGGLYSYHQLPTQSAKASFDFRLNTLLYSYALTDDTKNIFAHEGAHSLDGQGSINLDGLPALSADDSLVFRFIRAELFKQYYESKSIDPNNPNTFGLDEYAFKNTKEFWAETSEYFLSGEEGAQIILKISPELYDILSRYYNVDYDLT